MTHRVVGLLVLAVCLSSCERPSLSNAAPVIEVQPLALDFGPVPLGIQVSLPVQVRNLGRQELVLEPTTASAPDFVGLTSAVRLGAGERASIDISFTPTAEGERTGVVHLLSNAENDADVAIAVTGQGTARFVCAECTSPPASYCASERQLISYQPHGTCVANKCEYQATSTLCGTCVAAQCTDAPDAGVDAGVDAGIDAGVDAGVDAGIDAGIDAGPGSPVVFDTPGEVTWVVPSGVTSLMVSAWGGGGAGGNQLGATGGGGAFARGTLQVTPGESLVVWVAEGGVAPGGGAGASALLRVTTPLVIAAGGGGGGSDGCSGCKSGGRGGAGGGVAGEDGQNLQTPLQPYCTSATGGRGGTASAGGLGGTNSGTAAYRCNGQPGTALGGGRATGTFGNCETGVGATTWHQGGGQGNGGGGGGGAGVFGGGGAGFIWTYCSGGGGGGASFVSPSASGTQLEGGISQQQANPVESIGAGKGGSPGGNGVAGRVVLTF